MQHARLKITIAVDWASLNNVQQFNFKTHNKTKFIGANLVRNCEMRAAYVKLATKAHKINFSLYSKIHLNTAAS